MFELLINKELMDFAQKNLICDGKLYKNDDGYLYLKINDDFIYKLFGFVCASDKQLPDYFSESKNTGAHISVVYPGETLKIFQYNSLGQTCEFVLGSYFRAQIQNKIYFGCTIESPKLKQIRTDFGLGSQLNFKGIYVPFHFTIATKVLFV